jgi:Flp pilus assembly protein TadG
MALVPRTNRGSVFVEYAFSLPIFLALIFTSFDIVRYLYQSVSLQYSVAAASRWAIVGDTLDDPANPHVKLDRVSSIKYKIRQTAQKYGVSLSDSDIKICQDSDVTCVTDNANAASALQTMTLVVAKNFKTFIGASISLKASVVVSNENFA